MLSLAHRVFEAPLSAARSLTRGICSKFKRGSTPHSTRQSPSARGRLTIPASAQQPSPPPRHFGPKITWDSEKDGNVINAETMCAAFARSG